MRDLSRRAKVLLGGTVVGVLGAGMAGALMIPASAAATSAPAVHSASSSTLTICLTVREIHFGPTCVNI